TVTDVRVTGDSQQATVFYTVLGEETDLVSTAAALESAKGLLRSEVAKQLGMRHAPTLTFVADAVPENARHVEEVLARAKALDEEAAAGRGSAYAGEPDPYKKPREHDDEDEAEAEGPTPVSSSSTNRPGSPPTTWSLGYAGSRARARSATP